ncbi:MAG: hypothetical protein WB622_13540 [Acidobacteriaceae bacterium]
MTTAPTLNWLLRSDADPALRWQTLRDLTDASVEAIAAERARLPREGIAAAILSAQHPDGAWRRTGSPTWLTTLFTLQLLRATGIDPTDPVLTAAIAHLETSLQWNSPDGRWDLRSPEHGGNPFFEGEVEPCINGAVLALGGYFRHPSATLTRRLLTEQLPDGGWNCEAPKSQRSSFHTTICVLEGLLETERALTPAHELVSQIAAARRRAEEYLLQRSLHRRLSTGDIADPSFLQFAFPPRYTYNVLRALDYFRDAGLSPDPRMIGALQIVQDRQQPDGLWLLDATHNESLVLPFPESPGQPSRWITLRALRVLRWYNPNTNVILN